ncbi:MAG: DUF4178 domain-containing protein [Gemmataceae bacterium]
MSVQARCPACGGPVTFQVGTSLVTVCPYCRSAVGRSDRGLESLGKVADLVETQSPLDVGLKGSFEGTPFDLVGRTQFAHPAGGVWDEWYAAFPDGSWGWLAEAQGRFYMTFEEEPPKDLHPYKSLQLGQRIEVGGLTLTVAEKNRGKVAGASGEIPFRVVPGEEVPFADLSGPGGEFGTIDYSGDKPTLYVGRQVTLDELHIPQKARRTYPGMEPRINALQLNCPKCGAALELRAPDRSERVGCPSCGALSDVLQGQLRLLKSLEPPPVQPAIPLGAAGQRDGVEWTCIGFLQRYVTFEGVNFPWEEYLLYQPRLGFRWLTRSDGHWNWVEAVPPASVRVDGKTANYADQWYRLFQKAEAHVGFVVGEFYWKVQAGEAVASADYVNAPGMLSEEVTAGGGEGEVNWSFASYLPASEVEGMFGLKSPLPPPTTIGPNQPFPYAGVYKSAVALLGASLLLGFLFFAISPHAVVYSANIDMKPLPEGQRTHKVIVEEPLTLRPRRNIQVSLTPRADAGWVHLAGSLTPRAPPPTPGASSSPPHGERRDFAFLTTGGQRAFVYLSAVPAGEYTLQLDLSPRDPKAGTSAEARVEQGIAHPYPLMLTLLLLGVVPFVIGLYQLWFESRRWADSNVT